MFVLRQTNQRTALGSGGWHLSGNHLPLISPTPVDSTDREPRDPLIGLSQKEQLVPTAVEWESNGRRIEDVEPHYKVSRMLIVAAAVDIVNM